MMNPELNTISGYGSGMIWRLDLDLDPGRAIHTKAVKFRIVFVSSVYHLYYLCRAFPWAVALADTFRIRAIIYIYPIFTMFSICKSIHLFQNLKGTFLVWTFIFYVLQQNSLTSQFVPDRIRWIIVSAVFQKSHSSYITRLNYLDPVPHPCSFDHKGSHGCISRWL